MIHRLLYFGYYFKNLDFKKLKKFSSHVKQQTGKPVLKQYLEIIRDSFKYNISILEYYQFGFYGATPEEKSKWAGTGYMYKYQKLMNPPDKRGILDDKRKFYESYSEFKVHKVASIEELKADSNLIKAFLNTPAGKVVFKDATGKCGAGVKVVQTENLDRENFVRIMENGQFDMVEEFIRQHPAVNELAPSAVNTIRIFTQLTQDGDVEILGCRMRIAVSGAVDNLAAGNLAAPIDEHTGIISGPGVYSDITKSPENKHPVTGKDIVGFQIPFWQEIMTMVRSAALKHPQNRSVGWDVVLTPNGPGLIEGNHDWCKLVWQLPVGVGMKEVLEGVRSQELGVGG